MNRVPSQLDLQGHGHLFNSYFDFLQSNDPIERREDICPLSSPISIAEAPAVDWEIVRTYAGSCPSLAGVMSTRETYNSVAVKTGLRYAWSRIESHAHLLDVIESCFSESAPSIVLEPGCFTGGLLHFLSNHWRETEHVGFDLAPFALKVASKLAEKACDTNPPKWLECDFTQLSVEQAEQCQLGPFEGGLLILSNMIENVGLQMETFPYLEPWDGKARLISYWVNQGNIVLLAERHLEPMDLLETLVNHGAWTREGTNARLLSEFSTWTTTNITKDNPIGDWENTPHCIIGFFPGNSR